jgi:hypothetical protein
MILYFCVYCRTMFRAQRVETIRAVSEEHGPLCAVTQARLAFEQDQASVGIRHGPRDSVVVTSEQFRSGDG